MLGILLITIGSIGAASFYIPFRKVKEWAWESYWLGMAVSAWFILPLVFALLTVPSGMLFEIIHKAPSSAKWLTFMFGILWGVGGLTFGLSVRYMGIALGQSLVFGLAAVLGTLIPSIVAGDNLLATRSGILTITGVSIALAGIAIIGYAGVLKNENLREEERTAAVRDFALKKGILIAVLSGVMSACFAYGVASGKPIEEVAAKYGTNPLFVSNPTLIFLLFGGFVTNFIYCITMNIKNRTYRDYTRVSAGIFLNNLAFSFLAGLILFMQFHFYGMGKSQVPAGMEAFSWSILMALNIVMSNIWGFFFKEWKGVSRKTIMVLLIGNIVLILSTFIIKLN
jgi:L-rhamnose-H+ transport protein